MHEFTDNRPACDNLSRTIDMSRPVASQPREGKKPKGRPRKENNVQAIRVHQQLLAAPGLFTMFR
jgi:hypothetical protein